jgi:transketolase
VEVTTGPLGQGLGNAVGMAIAEANLRARFGAELCDHRTWVLCSDGDLEEGLSHEAASLAGHLRLGRLVAIYDDNRISIDGPTDLAFSDDTARRFEAYGWRVLPLGETANDLEALTAGLADAAATGDRPTLVILRSHIGWPSPRFTDTADAHGSPLGEEEVAVVKELLGLPVEETFWVPEPVRSLYEAAGRRSRPVRRAWEARHAAVREQDPARADDFDACLAGRGRDGWAAKLPTFSPGEQVATRVASHRVLNAIADVVPGLVGGGADLTANTGTDLRGHAACSAADPGGRRLHFGVREHAMGAVMNGMAVGGLLPFGGTFFVFSDYMRPSVRMAALAGYKVAFVWSHDSVGVGEDGPTHQPVEHLASLRAMPGLRLLRPADANEVVHAWRVHLEGDGPTGIVLTRQAVPVLEGTAERAPEGVPRGGYVLAGEAGPLRLVLVASGSEVALCLAARDRLAADGVRGVRVVSMPSWDLFAAAGAAYRAEVLPAGVPVLAVEAGASLGWERWADDVVALDRFGASAPGGEVMQRLGFTPDAVAARSRALLGGDG